MTLSLVWKRIDPRIAVATLLFSYLVMGLTLLGFNRTPWQAASTVLLCCALEAAFSKIFIGKVKSLLSAAITGMGISILLDYSHSYFLLTIPCFLAIGSKYVLTFNGKHAFNPAQFAVVASLVLTSDLISAAPAYQWNGLESMAVFMIMSSAFFVLPGIGRTPLVLSFLGFFTMFTALRAIIMRHHLPFETLFLGTLSSPSFLLFTFFMITDPATSSSRTRDQVRDGFFIAFLDLGFHLFQSYYTFFYAGFAFALTKFIYRHARRLWTEREWLLMAGGQPLQFWATTLRPWAFRAVVVGSVGLLSFGAYDRFFEVRASEMDVDFRLSNVSATSGLEWERGDVFERVDPRVQHVIKWLFSIGASASAGDYDADGDLDLLVTSPLARDDLRLRLYENVTSAGEAIRFRPVALPESFEKRVADIEEYGLTVNAYFVDFDNDKDQDIFVTAAFGRPTLLQNRLSQDGRVSFTDVSDAMGLSHLKETSVASTWFDANRDGRLDLVLTNILPSHLLDYDPPKELNFFDLPAAEYEGDRRMFNFMHSSWNDARNGGPTKILFQELSENGQTRFVEQDAKTLGITATHWSLAVSAADFDFDGFDDLYIANDFGPDELYLNRDGGQRFEAVKGSFFGTIGRDTYKGMNSSVADLTRRGRLDVYVSNVHHALQAEGSLLWQSEIRPDGRLEFSDEATFLGALNPGRFGWGAAIGDLNNDGWPEIVQSNGMVDNTLDPVFEDCPNYWYINEKIARSPPSIHRYADKWGDVRGACIHGQESNRLLLNRGRGQVPQFVDIAALVGSDFAKETNSRAIALADFDRDGRLDMVVTHMFAGPDLYQNLPHAPEDSLVSPPAARVALEGSGTNCNADAIGTRVWVFPVSEESALSAGEAPLFHQVQTVSGMSAQSTREIHMGLGDVKARSPSFDLKVEWCGDQRLTSWHRQLPADRLHRIKQSSPHSSDLAQGIKSRESATE